jgi:nucleotide-binding universal stress UspA family protein
MRRDALRQIVFATDYSDISRAAGRAAADLARQFRATLHVVHVVPPVTDPGRSGALADVVDDLGPGLDVVTAVLNGLPAREIVAYAQRHGAGLIVLGTHGRTGVSRVLLGSVAEAVVRRARCPVLTVPPSSTAEWIEEDTTVDEACVVCGDASADLICEACRTLVRGEAGAPH